MRFCASPGTAETESVIVGYFGHFTQISADFIRSCVEVGIPHTHDFNTAAGTLGVSKVGAIKVSLKFRISDTDAIDE